MFTKDDQQNVEIVEDSNIIPASPKQKAKVQIKIGTPVIKIKRLTQEEILQYSPSRRTSPEEGRAAAKVKLGNLGDNSNDSVHEHDDFSDLKPLEENQPSQGFTESKTNDVPGSQGFDLVKKSCSKKSENSSSKSKASETVPYSEVLFSQADSEMDSEPYNPELESTFRSNSDKKNANVFETDNLKSSQSSESGGSGASQSSQESVCNEPTPATYDPNLESTLAKDTPRRGRKRKQGDAQTNDAGKYKTEKDEAI